MIKVEDRNNEIRVFLDEQGTKPVEYKKDKLLSYGFHESITIQDFPIRKKAVHLHVRRRRWLLETENKVISRDWNAVAKGTRLTNDFATFLKRLFG